MPAHLHKRKGRRYWEIVEGRKRISTGTTRRVLAERVLHDYYLRGKGIAVNSHETLESYLESYLGHSERFNKPATVDDKRRTLEYFCAAIGGIPVAACSSRNVYDYLSNRRGARSKKEISAERWNSERQIISNVFKWLQAQKLCDHNPAKEIQKKKIVRNKIPKSLSLVEEKKLLRWCRRNDPELFRMAILVGNTAIRVRELAYLQWPDVAGDSLNVTAKEDWKPKDYEERSIPMSALVKAVIVRQRRTAVSRWVFPREDGERYGRGLDLRMVRAFKKAGLGSGGFHRLRHTYATRAIEAGMKVEALRVIMGHSDTKTLQKYMHVSPEHIKKQAGLVKFGG
jgi:integrase